MIFSNFGICFSQCKLDHWFLVERVARPLFCSWYLASQRNSLYTLGNKTSTTVLLPALNSLSNCVIFKFSLGIIWILTFQLTDGRNLPHLSSDENLSQPKFSTVCNHTIARPSGWAGQLGRVLTYVSPKKWQLLTNFLLCRFAKDIELSPTRWL